MRFVLHAEALNGNDALLGRIDRLVDRVADEVHRVEVPDADLLQGSSWYQTARPTRRKMLTSAVASPPRQRAASRGPHVKHVDVRTLDDATRADKLAHTALIVLVEDRESDGVLLDILVEELGWPELADLWARGKPVTPRAVELDSAGGNIERAVDDATREGRPVRLFVLCDSDVRWPGDTQSSNPVQAVRDACTAQGIPHHVLQKRNAENYIPDRVFEAVRDDPRQINDVDRFNALLARNPQRPDGSAFEPGEAARLLLQRGPEAMSTLCATVRDDDLRKSPANRLLDVAPNVPGQAKNWIVRLDPPVRAQVLDSHAIPPDSLQLLVDDDNDEFLRCRLDLLSRIEREFMQQESVTPPESDSPAPSPIDADDEPPLIQPE